MPARQREAPAASAAAFEWPNERIELCRTRKIRVGTSITLPRISGAITAKSHLLPAVHFLQRRSIANRALAQVVKYDRVTPARHLRIPWADVTDTPDAGGQGIPSKPTTNPFGPLDLVYVRSRMSL